MSKDSVTRLTVVDEVILMIFAIDEDRILRVYSTPNDAILEYEGVDVEDGVVTFYDNDGRKLMPRFVKPNKRGIIIGKLGWVISGVYELVPSVELNDESLVNALHSVESLAPNDWFTTIDEVVHSLRVQNVLGNSSAPKPNALPPDCPNV